MSVWGRGYQHDEIACCTAGVLPGLCIGMGGVLVWVDGARLHG